MTATAGSPLAVFAALADPSRQRVLSLVEESGATTATALAARLDLTRQAVDKHLAQLRNAGLVSSERHGREVRHRVRLEPLRATAAWLDDLADAWDRRLAAVKDLAERPDP